METKYVRSRSGIFAIFNTGIGLQHIDIVHYLEIEPRLVSDAGFVDVMGDRLEVYGKSLSIGVEASLKAEEPMNRALREGKMRTYALGGDASLTFATNAILPEDSSLVTSLEDLYRTRVFISRTGRRGR
jgi:hypothetical protein